MNDLAGLFVASDEFPQLMELCRNDAQFPPVLEQWRDLVRLSDEGAAAMGRVPSPLRITTLKFAKWCDEVGIVPCVDALRAYAIVHRTPAGDRRYGTVALPSAPLDSQLDQQDTPTEPDRPK